MRRLVAVGLGWAWSTVALAAPSLAELLVDAERAAEVREQDALADQARHEATAAGLALAPSVRAEGGYTRNQYEVVVQIPKEIGVSADKAVLTPLNQLDVSARATIPLVDVGAWLRVSAARARASGADATHDEARLDVARRVVAAYWQHAATAALLRSIDAERASVAADRDRVAAQVAAGLATALDLSLVDSTLAATDMRAAEAGRALRSSVRTLRGLTGRDLDPDDAPELPAAPPSDGTLDDWLTGLDDLPAVRAADARVRAARAEVGSGAAAFAPTVEGQASERVTNGPGFAQPFLWTAGVRARWNLLPADGAHAAALVAARRAAEAAADRVRRDTADAIAEAFDRVEALRTSVAAARAAQTARAAGLADAHARAAAGTATVEEVLRAEADHARSVAERVQAEGDLAAARTDLRLLAGREVLP